MILSKTKANLYSGLGNASMRRRYSLFSVEGEKAISDSIDFFKLEALLIQTGYVTSLKADSEKVFEVSESTMKKISNFSTPSKIMAIYKIPEIDNHNLNDINTDSLYVALDGVRDPGNMGTIIRTCHWFGIKSIFASNDCVDIYNPKTIQASMGSLGKVNLISCDLKALFEAHREMPVYGLLLNGKDIYYSKVEKNGFILMGNEGKGISENLRASITHPLYIPPGSKNHPESLNVSIATAVTLAIFQAKLSLNI